MNTIGFKGNSPQPAAKKTGLGNLNLKNLLGGKPAGKPANLEQAGDSFKKSSVEKPGKK